MNQKTLILVLLIIMVIMLGGIVIYSTWPEEPEPVTMRELPEIEIIDESEPPDELETVAPPDPGAEPLGGVTKPVEVEMTFDQLAQELGMNKADILHALGITELTSPEESVIDAARRHGMTLEQVYQTLEDY